MAKTLTAICRTPHRVRAEMYDGGTTRRCQVQVGANLRVNVIGRRSTGYVALQPVGDPLTVLLVAHVCFEKYWHELAVQEVGK